MPFFAPQAGASAKFRHPGAMGGAPIRYSIYKDITPKVNGWGLTTRSKFVVFAIQLHFKAYCKGGREMNIRTNFWALITTAAAIAALAAPVARAEDDMAARVAMLEKRVKELEAQTVLSLPELIVRERKVYVCEKGHSFTKETADGRCPHDGTKLTAQKTYQKEKYYRRKTIEEKIEESLASIQPVTLGLSVTGMVFQTAGTGRDHPNLNRSQNKKDLYGSGSFDLQLSARPAYQTTLFADLEAMADTGARTRIPALTSLNSAANRHSSQSADNNVENEEINLREAWISTVLGRCQEWTLVSGSMDLAGVVDQNNIANDETLQFVSDAFVNSPFLGKPENGAAFAAIYDPKGPYALKLAVQRINVSAGRQASKIAGRLYSVGELVVRTRLWKGLQNGNYRFWVRSAGEVDRRENIGYGVSFDQAISRTMNFFGRYGSQRPLQPGTAANSTRVVSQRDDLHASAGIEVRGPEWTFFPRDVWAVALSRTEIRSLQGQQFELVGNGGGENESLVEGYYRFFITEHLHMTPFVQWLADSTRAELVAADDLAVGLRTQVDF